MLRRGGARFKAGIQGLAAEAVSITDRGDGSYGVQYTVPCEGTYCLTVTGPDGNNASGSPATLTDFMCCL